MTTVLLVEDNEMNREMLERCLRREGFRVVTAKDGRQAIDTTRREHPDLIAMDLSLPEVDGWEATRTLKHDRATAGIPIIALTAHAMVDDRKRAIEAGCDEYESKPVDMPRLMQKIRRLTGSTAQPTPSQ